MALSPDLYARFIKGECTEEEHRTVMAYLREHPEEMEDLLMEPDWDNFRPDGKLHPAVLQRVFTNIQQDVDKYARNRMIWKRVAVAAVLTGIIVLTGALFLQQDQPDTPVAMESSPAITWKEYTNNGKLVKQLMLEDSSHIELGPGSTLRCKTGFEKDKRELWLKGKAKFDVAKDKDRPFTVYAGNTAVTALGTVFGVNERGTKVTVKLYSGKVVVHPQTGVASFNKVYLQPGESLVYDLSSKKQPLVNKPAVLGREPVTGQEVASNSLVFHQQPLPQILQQLERHFNIKIACDAKRLQHIRVTAEFTTSDTPAEILENIALLNDLTLERTAEGGFLLKK
ncbi:FecR family protein [Chitinophaga sp. YR627]|uniref:FecR family protein n=1 Tax=Chitinophaga sp. YR627 TaxID=1881041 RepID=UPI0008E4CDDE|nr:FecR domain-containing protein [Chitinophaga sp. YR627]SFP02083.1 FecR family protein [Chitinophaga sp. YR627]